MKNITVAGGGLVGSLLSIFLAKRGFEVNVYEKRPDMRKADIAAGRSINLVVSDRGWKALDKVGISSEIKKITIPVYGRMTHDLDGKQKFLPYSVKKRAIYSVSRGGLNSKLMDIAEQYPSVNFHFNEKCIDVETSSATAVFQNMQTGEKTTVTSDIIIGADGAFSEVRNLLQKTNKLNCSIEYIDHGYKELIIPANEDGGWKLDKNALHIWPRKKFMLMALANLDGGFTCTLFFPLSGGQSFETIKNQKELLHFFNGVFPDAIPLMPDLAEDYFRNPASSLMIVRCFPWSYQDKVALIGDAAHAIVPFFGEGMNCGFEDCYVLNNLIDEHGDDWNKIFENYGRQRKPNGDAIAELSLRNFIEMRDLVADPEFLLRKEIEAKLHKKFPGKWTPLYSLVKFSDIPYQDALKEGERQDVIMKKIMAIEGIEGKWDFPEIEKEILNLL